MLNRILLMLEFSVILNFQQFYDLVRPHIETKLFLRAMIMPEIEYEKRDIRYRAITYPINENKGNETYLAK